MKEFQRVEEGINDLSLGNIKNIIENLYDDICSGMICGGEDILFKVEGIKFTIKAINEEEYD